MPWSFSTPLCALLGIRYPILLAGMAGGPTTPELVAAVSAAGGLGTFGAAGMRCEALADAIRRARALTDRPIAVNVLLAPARPGTAEPEALHAALASLRDDLGIGPPAAPLAPARPPIGLAKELALGVRPG